MTFTLTQLLQIFLTLCGSIITVGGAGTILIKIMEKRRKPDKDRDEMIKKHTEMLDNDNKRLKAVEEDSKITMKALLAIMRHELDGNHVEDLRRTMEETQEYLINR